MTEQDREDKRDTVLSALIEDPTRSAKKTAEELDITRQKLWREKKRMEDEGLIWGYSAIVDDTSRGWKMYAITFSTKALTGKAAARAIERVRGKDYVKDGVRVLNVLMVNGPFDILLTFAAPNRQAARRYINSIALAFEENLTAKPRAMDVVFPIIREGKPNPNMERFNELVP
jgi:DNA-binding Lrp family transcriptional regulator